MLLKIKVKRCSFPVKLEVEFYRTPSIPDWIPKEYKCLSQNVPIFDLRLKPVFYIKTYMKSLSLVLINSSLYRQKIKQYVKNKSHLLIFKSTCKSSDKCI